jgi:hypothetical protein
MRFVVTYAALVTERQEFRVILNARMSRMV